MRFVEGTDLARLLRGRGSGSSPVRGRVVDRPGRGGARRRAPRRGSCTATSSPRTSCSRARATRARLLTDFGLMKNLRSETQITRGRERDRHVRLRRARAARRGAGRRPHRRLRARRRALPGAHRQGPVPARDRRGDDARAPRLAAAVGARRRCPTRPSGSARWSAARWPRTRTSATRRPATSAAPRWPPSTGRRSRPAQPSRRASAPGWTRDARAPRRDRPAPARARGRDRRAGRSSAARTLLRRLRERYARRPRASASSCCSPASPGSARRGWRPSSRARAHARGRDRALRPLGRRVARPLPAVHHRASSTTSPTARRWRCRAELDARADRARALRPRAAPPRARAARAARRGRRDAPLPAVRGASRGMLAFAARERPVVLILDDLQWADTSTTLLLGHLLQDAEPMRLLVLGTVARGRRSGELIELRSAAATAGVRADRARRARRGRDAGARRRDDARDVSDAFVRRLQRGDRGQPVLHRGDAAQPAGRCEDRAALEPRSRCPRASRR